MNSSSLLAVWGWGSAAMLAWGGAALIPVLLHLWARRQRGEIPWGAMRFLRAAWHEQARRWRLEQLLLLLLRVGLVLTFAVAMADPLWSAREGDSEAHRPPLHHVLVWDSSFSMGLREGEQTRAERARHRLREVVETSPPGDGFSLVVLDSVPRAVSPDLQFDRPALLRQIDALAVGHGVAQFAPFLQRWPDVLREQAERYPQLQSTRVEVATDLGWNTWSAVTREDWPRQWESLVPPVAWRILEVGGEEGTNLSLESLTASRTLATPGDKVRLSAVVRGWGLRQSVSTRVEFLRDGRSLHVADLVLAPGESREIHWEATVSPTDAADLIFSARLPTDALPRDDERWVVVRVRRALSVLAIAGEPRGAEYASLALNPNRTADTGIQVTVRGEGGLLEGDLAWFDCLLLCDVPRLAPRESAAIGQFLRGGGGVLIALGNRADSSGYLPAATAADENWLPARIGNLERGEQFLDPLRYEHPSLAVFRGRERSGLLTVPTWRYRRLTPVTGATPVLGFQGGDPAIVERRFGRGRCFLLAFPLSPEVLDRTGGEPTPWTALPIWPSFPPLIHSLVHTACSGQGAERTLAWGEPLVVAIPGGTSSATLTSPTGETESFDIQTLAGESVLGRGQPAWTVPDRCGVYSVTFRGAPDKLPEQSPFSQTGRASGESLPVTHRYAVNVASEEGNPRRFDFRQLPPPLVAEVDSSDAASARNQDHLPTRWFRPLLGGALLLYLAEHWLVSSQARRSA